MKLSAREFTPNVVEPSFGIGRILYSLLEHAYWAREEDALRGVRLCLQFLNSHTYNPDQSGSVSPSLGGTHQGAGRPHQRH